MTADDSLGSIRVEPATFTENLCSLADILIHCQNIQYFCRTGKEYLLKSKEKFITPKAPERQIGESVNSCCDRALLQANK